MVALRLAVSSLLKFKLGRLRGHQVVFSRYAQKMISRFLTAAQFSHRATCYSPLTIDFAIQNIWGAVLHSLCLALLTLKPPNRLSVGVPPPNPVFQLSLNLRWNFKSFISAACCRVALVAGH